MIKSDQSNVSSREEKPLPPISFCSFASRKIAMVKVVDSNLPTEIVNVFIDGGGEAEAAAAALSHSISRGSSHATRLSFPSALERNGTRKTANSIPLQFNRGKRSDSFHRNFISFFLGRASEEIERENLMRLRRFSFFVSPLVDENENFVGILFFKLEDWKVRLKLREIYNVEKILV